MNWIIFPLYRERVKTIKKRKVKDGPNALCCCCCCTRWELNEERNVMAVKGVECAEWNCVSVCVCVCVEVTTTWDQLHIKKCPVASLTMRARAGWEEICIAMRQRERKVIDAHITLRVLTKHCLICYGFSRPLSVSYPTCLTLFMWLSSGLTTCHASWPVIKHCVMIQSQIYLHCAAGSCHLACFRNQITFQSLLYKCAPPPPHCLLPATKSLQLVKCFQEKPRGGLLRGEKHGICDCRFSLDAQLWKDKLRLKGTPKHLALLTTMM